MIFLKPPQFGTAGGLWLIMKSLSALCEKYYPASASPAFE
jgi:hypothetical protein